MQPQPQPVEFRTSARIGQWVVDVVVAAGAGFKNRLEIKDCWKGLE